MTVTSLFTDMVGIFNFSLPFPFSVNLVLIQYTMGFSVVQMVKNLPAVQETGFNP